MNTITKRTPTAGIAGFTLVELMITVGIVTILAAIAYPSYVNSVRKGHRSEGQQALLQIAQQQEKYFSVQNKYADTLTALGYHTDPYVTENGYYSISVLTTAQASAVTGSTCDVASGCFVLEATAVNGQANDSCKNLELDSTGRKYTTNSALTAADCW